jgi:DNA polymerase III sliding clamp (beta) subunit (PCNA family)
METFKVNPLFFGMASTFVSTEEARYYLNGVFLEPHPLGIGAILVATDGHRLAAIYDKDAIVPRPAIMATPKELIAAVKKIRATGDFLLFERGEKFDDVKAEAGAMTLKTHEIDGTFPDWRRVIPKRDGILTPDDCEDPAAFRANKRARQTTLNSRYAAAFEFKGWLQGKENPITIITPPDPATPVIIKQNTVPEFLGIVMPMRDVELDEIPDWLKDSAS